MGDQELSVPQGDLLASDIIDVSADGDRQVPVFRLFGFFLPDTSILRRFRFQLIVASRFLSEMGQEGVFYGSLVLAAKEGSALQAAILGVAKHLPGAFLGLVGGAVADALPRRVALGLGYGLQAGMCVLLPIIGTGFGMLIVLVLGVSTLNQFVGPSEKAVLPLVSKREEISSAAAIMSLSDSIATGVGTAAVAPLILVTAGARPLFFVCAAFLAFATIRVLALPIQKEVTVKEALKRLHISELDIGFRKALSWLMGWPAIVTIIMVGMMVSVMSAIAKTLGPSYVADVLHSSPEKTVYVFAPAGIGALIALALAPSVINAIGERRTAAIAVLVATGALFTMALIDPFSQMIGPVNPFRVLRLAGLHPTDEVLGAGLVSMFGGFAVSMSSVSVQTYLNRRVPLLQQGRVFGLQSVLANVSVLVPMLLLGFIAERTSIQAILFFAPWVILGGVYALLLLATRWTQGERMDRRQVLRSFWLEPEETAAHPV